jgi:hypothetical protein
VQRSSSQIFDFFGSGIFTKVFDSLAAAVLSEDNGDHRFDERAISEDGLAPTVREGRLNFTSPDRQGGLLEFH